MSSGLLTRAWSGWRRVIRIGAQGVVWAAPCHWDCLGGAVSWGLMSGWRRVIGIGDQGVVWAEPCLGDC